MADTALDTCLVKIDRRKAEFINRVEEMKRGGVHPYLYTMPRF
jgi:hypothetical protein